MSSLGTLRRPANGDEFLDVDALINALDDWAVLEKFCFRTQKREHGRAVWVCAEEGCRWRVRTGLVEGEEDMGTLVVTVGEHSCVSRGVRKFSSSSKKTWLDRVVSHLNLTKKTTPKAIVDCLRVCYAELILYKRAQDCRLRLLDGDNGKQRHSFELLPAYKELLEKEAPDVHIDLVRDRHDRFTRIFVCPAQSSDTFRLSRRFFAVDGTFLKARFILTLLAAVGIDANGEIVLLAWAMVESDNRLSWEWFFQHLRWSISSLTGEAATFISDR